METNNINWHSLYIEIGHFHGAIKLLLESINDKVDSLPDGRDHTQIIEKINKLLIDIEKLKTDKHESINLMNLIQEIKRAIENYNSIIIDLQQILSNENSILVKQIKCVNQLSEMLLKEISDAKIILGHDMFKLSDLNEVITFAKRSNKRHDMFKGWKGKLMIGLGGVLGLGVLINYITNLIHALKDFFQ